MTGLRVNLDPGGIRLDGWTSLTTVMPPEADAVTAAFDLVADHGADISHIFIGRLLEAMTPSDALSLLNVIAARTPPGTVVTAVAVDVRLASESLLNGEVDESRFNALLTHSSFSRSVQMWSYDGSSLLDLFSKSELEPTGRPDPLIPQGALVDDPQVCRWLCGASGAVRAGHTAGRPASKRMRRSPEVTAVEPLPKTVEASLLEELAVVRAELERVRAREQTALSKAGQAEHLSAELRDSRRMLDGIRNSTTYRVARGASLVARRLLPKGSRQRRIAARLLRATTGSRQTRAPGSSASETPD